jgi:anti-sigma factor RsiW
MNWLRRRLDRTEDECCGERLSAYIDHELTPEERIALERHLAECEDCRWNLETLRQTIEWTRSSAPVRLPRVFTIPVETGAPQAARGRRPAWGLPLLQGATALVALLFVVVVAGDLFLGSSASRSAPQMVAIQPTAAMDQAAAVQEVEVTQLVQIQPAPTMAVEAAVPEQPSEPGAAKALPPVATAAPPSAPEALTMAAPTPTATAEAGGIGGGEPAVSVTMEAMAATVEMPLETPQGAPRVEATSGATVTLAFTATTLLLTQPLTVQVTMTMWTTVEHMSIRALSATATAAAATYPTAAAAPQQDLLLLPTAEPAVETATPARAPTEKADGGTEQGAETMAVTEEALNAAVPTEAPYALLPGSGPTAIAAAPEVRDVAQEKQAAVEEPGIVGTLRETVAPWFSLAEIVLGAAFALLALATAVVMFRWQPR